MLRIDWFPIVRINTSHRKTLEEYNLRIKITSLRSARAFLVARINHSTSNQQPQSHLHSHTYNTPNVLCTCACTCVKNAHMYALCGCVKHLTPPFSSRAHTRLCTLIARVCPRLICRHHETQRTNACARAAPMRTPVTPQMRER